MPIMPALANPSKKVAELVTKAVDVRLAFTFSNKRCTPCSNTLFSWGSALNPFITRAPFRVSVNRPVTSALSLPLSLKIGRILAKALSAIKANKPTGTKTKTVIVALMRSKSTREMIAVKVPPTNCTKPVPTRLRTPSTSVIILETKAPDF